ncbi:Trehalose 6-phosphate phosphatase [Rhynchospora pubera]|uniref:Trehalose 6-phosphate phosphatase n=1 Tax=Rhynchospora pubera TaxID=906938 RepID=A0AAV8HCT1_9POAL|nr:Trehalose 6-phosphate phosphatase [Rhynchospora pubera]
MLQKTKEEEPKKQLPMSMENHKMTVMPLPKGRNSSIQAFIPACDSTGNDGDNNNITKNLPFSKHLHFDVCKCNTTWLKPTTSPFPTQRGCNAVDPFATPHDRNYDQWIIQHPSALENFKEIVASSKGKSIVMFLDYDGTLSPIVDNPDRAFMDDEMRDAVREVASCFPTAIVTGRSRDKVYKFVKLEELYYAGSHGMDIQGPKKGPKFTKIKEKAVVLFQPASKFLPLIREVYKLLVERTKSTPGAKVENNKFCLSVHFRCVDPQKWSSLAEQVNAIIKEYPNLRLTRGRKVLEIRPIIRWDKGKALEFLLESLGFADLHSVFPIYIGDDQSDEDAFKVLQHRRQGAGILVSKSPKETGASYSLREPAEVMKFLHGLVESNKVTVN